MSEIIEIEFKNLLTKSEYDMLLKQFNIADNQVFTQENHYFDTPDFALKGKGSALRIREKQKQYEMTLKQPADVGLLETSQILSSEEFINAIKHNHLPNGIIQDRLTDLKIVLAKVEYFGSLITKRVEFPYRSGLLVLDHSMYLNSEDFEMEFEVENFQIGQQEFQKILEQFGIPQRKTDNKIARFYRKKFF